MANKKEFVTIHSKITINVTAGLQLEDVTNPDAHVADRLKVNPLWPKTKVLIKEGVGVYPAYIAEWNTVKLLQKDKYLTIGEYLDTAEAEVVATKEKLDLEMKDVEEKTGKKKKEVNLAEIAGE